MNYSHTTLSALWLNLNGQAATMDLINKTMKQFNAADLLQMLIDKKVI
jgi:hypothetical protein